MQRSDWHNRRKGNIGADFNGRVVGTDIQIGFEFHLGSHRHYCRIGDRISADAKITRALRG